MNNLRLSSSSILGLLTLTYVLSGCGGSSGNTSEPVVSTPIDNNMPTTDTPEHNNILLIIADDQGLDASAQYNLSSDLPNTPNIDTLANNGLVFENAWATPACTTTRATLITGKYGERTGVTYVPAHLSNDHQLLQSYLVEQLPDANYGTAVFGKWHLAGGNPQASHPNDLGIEYYAGNIANIDDYYNWELNVNGVVETVSDYHTSKITDLAGEWIAGQEGPWFAWVAYSAPHSPFHLPPEDLHSRDLDGSTNDINNNRRDYFLTAIEALDTEIGRLISSLDEDVRDNTLIIYMGDNGTPARVIDTATYAQDKAKGSLYQGGIAVPMVISGAGVDRQGERETALVTATDLFATIANFAGVEVTNVFDSHSFAHLFSSQTSDSGDINSVIYTEFESIDVTGVAVRDDQYKFIKYLDDSRELFNIADDFAESNNLINNTELSDELSLLEGVADNINDLDTGQAINVTDAILTNSDVNCASYVASYTSDVNDVNRSLMFEGDLSISVSDNQCTFSTNAIPNHDFNDGDSAFPNNVSEQNDTFQVTTTPEIANESTPLSLEVDNAILLNGVKVDILAAGCFGVGDGKVGCNDMSTPWRYDPMHPANGFRVDGHNAHAQPDGTYHYHGSPFALFAEDDSKISPVIGFAADGFPIFGSYITPSDLGLVEPNNTIRKVKSSYQLKQGPRPSGEGEPAGTYDGSFRDDYEYVDDLGDLDECNGTIVNGHYGYFITDNYPYVLGCFKGTPDQSFSK